MLLNIWVKDKRNGHIHQVGTNAHDSLELIDGKVEYIDLQCMCGTLDGEYVFVESGSADDDIWVEQVRHGKWTLSVRSFYMDTYSEESELAVYITASCSECGEKYPNGNISGQIFSETIYAPEGKEYGYKFDEIYERQKVLDKFNLIDYNFKKYCPNCGAKMDGGVKE